MQDCKVCKRAGTVGHISTQVIRTGSSTVTTEIYACRACGAEHTSGAVSSNE